MVPSVRHTLKRRRWLLLILVGALLTMVVFFRHGNIEEKIVPRQSDSKPCADCSTFTDPRDGNVYRTVQIGRQCWLAENLRYLPAVFPSTAPPDTAFARYFVYDYQGTNIAEAKATDQCRYYGVLYNWCAAMTEACPLGWHLPSDAEWAEMTDYLINKYEQITAQNVAFALKYCRQVDASAHDGCNTQEHPCWSQEKEPESEFSLAAIRQKATSFMFRTPVRYGTDSFSFTALPSGRCCYGAFQRVGDLAYWWTATPASPLRAWSRQITNGGTVNRWDMNKAYGYAVRCVRN